MPNMEVPALAGVQIAAGLGRCGPRYWPFSGRWLFAQGASASSTPAAIAAPELPQLPPLRSPAGARPRRSRRKRYPARPPLRPRRTSTSPRPGHGRAATPRPRRSIFTSSAPKTRTGWWAWTSPRPARSSCATRWGRQPVPRHRYPAGRNGEFRARRAVSEPRRVEGAAEGRRQFPGDVQIRQSGHIQHGGEDSGHRRHGLPAAATGRRGDTTSGVSPR